MLNKNLEDEVKIHLVGLIIKKQKFICTLFDEKVQSEIIFLIKQKNYSIDDSIFEEGDTYDKDTELVGFSTEQKQVS